LELLTDTEETGQVVVHCHFKCKSESELIRVWKTTYLIDRASDHKSKMLFADNITIAPIWTPVMKNESISFTLIFEALPKGCTSFDFAEIIPEPGGFLIEGISRNNSDIYSIDLTYSSE